MTKLNKILLTAGLAALLGACQSYPSPDPAMLSSGPGAQIHNASLLETLETLPDRSSLHWTDPETGAEGYAVPLGTYQSASGLFCRDYYTKAIVGNASTLTHGSACRMEDGSWRVNRQL